MRGRILLILGFFFAAFLTGCGGSKPVPGVQIALSPSSASLIPGQVVTFTAAENDSTGAQITKQPVFTFTSSSPNVTLSSVNNNNSVDVCAGTFDAAFVNCTPAGGPTQVTLTATADGLTGTAGIFVHQPVTSVTVTPGSTSGCVSAGGTQVFTARAFNNGVDVTSTVGPFTWTSTQPAVASVSTSGLATALTSGTSGIFASTGGVTSVPSAFNTCGVKSINLHVSGTAATSLTVANGASGQVSADIVDTNGASVPNVPLAFSVNPSPVAAVGSGTVTGSSPGTAQVVASCSPPSCNIGLGFAVYSNPVSVTVSGTVSTTNVFAASTASTTMVPITAPANTLGTAISLPAAPNSILAGPSGTNVYLGSANGLIEVNSGTSAVTTVVGAPGKLLAVDPNETSVIVSNGNNVFIVDVSTSTITTLNIAGATAAAWTPDSFEAYILAGNRVFQFSSQFSLRNFNLSATANDMAFLNSGRFAYFAQTTSSVSVRRPCDNAQADSVTTKNSPQRIAALPNDSAVIAVDSTGIDVITPTVGPGAGCGQAVSDTTAFVDFGVGAFTAKQIFFTYDSANVFLIAAGLNQLLDYNVGSNSVSGFTLAGGAIPLSGGAFVDSTTLYLGASDGSVHQITLGPPLTDAAQIAVSSVINGNPDLVAVMP